MMLFVSRRRRIVRTVRSAAARWLRDARGLRLPSGGVGVAASCGAVIPYAKSGIIGGIVLGLGRALGETMAVTMLIGNQHRISASLFSPAYTMASLIANEFSEASNDLHLSALMAVGFVLFLITLIVNAVARWLVWRVASAAGKTP
jgi:ABC-type phosphate transport system permease subunit